MGYLLYTSVFFLLVLSTGASQSCIYQVHLLTSTAAFLTRAFWLESCRSRLPSIAIPSSSFLYSRLPSTFASDIESGLSSSTFDLSGNVASGDSRAGLDDSSKKEIQKIMRNRRVGFDEARRIYTEGQFANNNIGPDGRPRDPKFVSFS